MGKKTIKLPYKAEGRVPSAGAVIVGDLVFVSGVEGIDPATGKLVEGVEKQTEMALKNVESILQEAGTSLENIIKSTIYITKKEDLWPAFNTMTSIIPKPEDKANCDLWVAALPGGSLFKIEVVAAKV